MARLNIEIEELLKDQRFIDLILAFGSRREAYGAFLEAIVLAQQYWVPNRVGIPKEVWKKQRLANELLDVGFANVVPATGDDVERVMFAGSARQFDWLIKKSDAGKLGGPAAAKARVENIIELARQKSSNDDTRQHSTVLTSSSSYSPSSSFSLSPSDSASEEVPAAPSASAPPKRTRKPKADKKPAKTTAVWEAFTSAYLVRHKIMPADCAQIRGQMSKFIDKVGAEDAPEIARYFVESSNGFHNEKAHDFGFCLSDAVKLRKEWLTGKIVTRTETRNADRKQATINAWGPLIEEAEAREALEVARG